MRQSNTETLQLSRRYLDLIGGRPMSLAEKQAFIAETVDAYEKHVNRGFISYRKSVTEAGQFAALEWSGHGAQLQDLLGQGIHRLPRRLRHLQRGHQSSRAS
jgi:putrescine aminotransferase